MPSDLEVAVELADLADAITMQHFRGDRLGVSEKPDRSLVSVVDTEVELRLRGRLSELRPDDAITGEETGKARDQDDAPRRWLIDPIDYTANYVRGIPEFATLIALETDDIQVGLVSAPALQRRWWAELGGGAWRNGDAIVVSQTASVNEANCSIAAIHLWRGLERVEAVLLLAQSCRYVYGSGAFLNQMRVAEGDIDICLEPWGEAWDLAPVKLIVEEAGGRFTDIAGESTANNKNALITNGKLHAEVLRYLGDEGTKPAGCRPVPAPE